MNINDIPVHVFDAAEIAYKAEKWASPKIRLRYAITQAFNLMPSELERLRAENERLQRNVAMQQADLTALWVCVSECMMALKDGTVNSVKLREALDKIEPAMESARAALQEPKS